MQLSVLNSPFNQEQAELLNQLLPTLTESQKVWICGFLSASQAVSQSYTTQSLPQTAAALELLEKIESPVAEQSQEVSEPISKNLTILYGSQSGNAQGFAKKTGKTLEEQGFEVKVTSMSDFKTNQLKKLDNLLIIVSTHGDGEPPDNAISFHEFLHGKRAPKLDGLNYSVLALGDLSYDQFCQTGKEFDERLKELGGTQIYPRIDCDVDYDEQAEKWLKGVLDFFSNSNTGSAVNAAQVVTATASTEKESNYSRKNPFKAEILENINLNGRGSNKETRHLELSLEDSGLTYKPGDALGILPENDPALVKELLTELNFDQDEKVTVQDGEQISLKEAFTSYFEITTLTKVLLQNAANLTGNKELQELTSPVNKDKLKAYLEGRDLLDLVRDHGPWNVSPQEFVSVLRKIPARLYSIASSIEANPEEVHLTIGAVRYEANGREYKGVCSTYVAERLEPGDKVSVFVQHNENFRLPENPETPIIMIGPGTGVAPFRAFMQEREEQGAIRKIMDVLR